MRPIVSAALVNGVLGDPALYLDFRDERRAVLFDLGDIGRLMPKKILRLTDVFVSHAHMDHFAGFDRLLRVCLGRHRGLRLYGPPGFVDRVEHKLAAYTWNLVERYPGDFALSVHEVAPDWSVSAARFRASARFTRERLPEQSAPGGLMREEPRFRVRAALLDHGIACLGFALEEKVHVNVIDAAAGGASDGLSLALNVAGMLIAFLAFIAMFDFLLGWVSPGLTLAGVFAVVFAPVAFLMGVPAADIGPMADLLGTKLVANEFVAFVKLTGEYRGVMSERSYVLATFALTGFANVASVGIQLGGIGGMAPNRRSDLARLGTRALLAGFVATLVNACVASMML